MAYRFIVEDREYGFACAVCLVIERVGKPDILRAARVRARASPGTIEYLQNWLLKRNRRKLKRYDRR